MLEPPKCSVWIARASSGADEMTLILAHRAALSATGMVSRTSSCSIGEASMRSSAGSDRTPCVHAASTRFAPFCWSCSAAMQSVPAVSTMSSSKMHVLPTTLPTSTMAATSLARSRFFEKIAMSVSSALASISARLAPPASGETMTTSPLCFAGEAILSVWTMCLAMRGRP